MRNTLVAISSSSWYWAGLAGLGVAMLTIALVYQYMLDTLPCVLCIHVRLWVVAMIVLAVGGLWLRRSRMGSVLTHLCMTFIMLVLLERGWQLLAIERGIAEGSCTFDTGLPSWFAVDQWFPWLFKVWESCGYTPVLAFGITMAEAQLVIAASLLVVNTVLLCIRLFVRSVTAS